MKKIRVEGFNSTRPQQTYKELAAMRSVTLILFLENRSSPVFSENLSFSESYDIIISVYLTECQRKVFSTVFSVLCSASFPRRFEPVVTAVSDFSNHILNTSPFLIIIY